MFKHCKIQDPDCRIQEKTSIWIRKGQRFPSGKTAQESETLRSHCIKTYLEPEAAMASRHRAGVARAGLWGSQCPPAQT